MVCELLILGGNSQQDGAGLWIVYLLSEGTGLLSPGTPKLNVLEQIVQTHPSPPRSPEHPTKLMILL